MVIHYIWLDSQLWTISDQFQIFDISYELRCSFVCVTVQVMVVDFYD